MNDSFERSYARYQEAIAKANTLNKATVFDALATAGITAVTVTFDGEGDSGQIEDLLAYSADKPTGLPPSTVTMQTTSWGQGGLTTCEQSLKEALEQLCYDYLEEKYAGWENNDGAYGEFTFDVFKRTIDLEFNGRFSDVTTENHTL